MNLRLRQWPFLASALTMLAGVYLLAGPFRSERSDITRLLPVWGALLAYEFLVIGGVALLRRRGADTTALTAVSLIFLGDVLFLGDAFASTDLDLGLRFNLAAWVISLVKALALARAVGYETTSWRAGWVAAALYVVHLVPSYVAFPAARPADFSDAYWAAIWAASALVLPLFRQGRIGWIFGAAAAVHLAASGIVGHADLQLRYATPPLLAAAFLVPRRYAAAPVVLSFLCSPLRAPTARLVGTVDGIGVLLVAAAFVLLALGVRSALPRRKVIEELEAHLSDLERPEVREPPMGS